MKGMGYGYILKSLPARTNKRRKQHKKVFSCFFRRIKKNLLLEMSKLTIIKYQPLYFELRLLFLVTFLIIA